MAKKYALIGRVLQDTYRVEGLLGEGGMGAVYEVSHLRLAQRFAVKVLDPHVAEHPDALARFRREAEITSAIGHPHIVLVIDFNYTEDDDPYIIMEMLEGEDLYTRIKRHVRLDLPAVASVFRQTASALQAAHQKGVIHRDLKSKNIFLCRRGDRHDFVKVVDFGISKMLGTESVLTHANQLIGTPCYMAPEQADTQVDVDLRADIYSMGVILYEMLAGRPPFQGGPVPALLYQIVHRPPPPLRSLRPDVPAPVAALIERALSKRPEQRFNSMRRFWREFAQVLALEGDSAGFYEPTEDRTEDWLQSTEGPAHVPLEVGRLDLTQPLTDPALLGSAPTISSDGLASPVTQSLDSVDIEVVEPSAAADGRRGRPGSTLWESAGQVETGPSAARRHRGLILGGLGFVVLAGAVMVMLISVFDGEPGELAGGAGGADSARVADATGGDAASQPVAVAPLPKTHTVRVAADRPATCQALVGARTRAAQLTPCRYEGIEDGARLHLVVTAEGYRPYVASWAVRADRALALSLLARARRITVAGTPDDPPPAIKRAAGQGRRKRPRTTPARPTRKKPRTKRIGDGIMGLD